MAASHVPDDVLLRIQAHRRAIAKRLGRARAKTGLSLDSVAELSGIGRSRWARFERGAIAIPAELLPLLAKAINTNVAALVAA